MLKLLKLLIATVVLTFVTSCGQPTPPSDAIYMTKAPQMTYAVKGQQTVTVTPRYIQNLFSEQVSEKLYLYNPNRMIFNDGQYSVPEKTYVLQKFNPWFKQTTIALGVETYAKSNDCDKHAQAYKLLACFAHYRSTADTEAPSVGVVIYTTRYNELHTINILVVSNRLEIIFVEPQTGEQVFLTEKERDSIVLVEF